MFNMNVDTNRARFAHDLESMGFKTDDLLSKDTIKELPVALDEFNILIAQYGKPAYKSEGGAVKAWANMVQEYLDGLALASKESNKRSTRELSAAAEAEAEAADLPSSVASKELVACEKTLGTVAKHILSVTTKANIDYLWHDMVIPVVEYIKLGRLAGRNSVETMSEIRQHVYDLSGYKARNKKEGTPDLDQETKAQFEINTAFEGNVTRAVKCGLLSERASIDFRLGEHDGKVRLLAPFNQIEPIVTVGDKQVPNKYDHIVPVSIKAMEALYSEVFKGQKRGTKSGSVEGLKGAAATLAANAPAYKELKADIRGDIDTAMQALMVQPVAVKAAMTGQAVAVIHAFTDTIKGMTEADDDTIVALSDLAGAIDDLLEAQTTPAEVATSA